MASTNDIIKYLKRTYPHLRDHMDQIATEIGAMRFVLAQYKGLLKEEKQKNLKLQAVNRLHAKKQHETYFATMELVQELERVKKRELTLRQKNEPDQHSSELFFGPQ